MILIIMISSSIKHVYIGHVLVVHRRGDDRRDRDVPQLLAELPVGEVRGEPHRDNNN